VSSISSSVCAAAAAGAAAQVAARVHELAGLDISSADGIRRTASAVRLRQLISADVGGGMLELYWLPAMEAVRQWGSLHDITRRLLNHTWATHRGSFKPPAGERVQVDQVLSLSHLHTLLGRSGRRPLGTATQSLRHGDPITATHSHIARRAHPLVRHHARLSCWRV
jgi:hypothetical protein